MQMMIEASAWRKGMKMCDIHNLNSKQQHPYYRQQIIKLALIIIMSETLPKYGSVDLRRKVNSHTKLPRLPSVEIGNKLSENNIVKKQSTHKISLLGEQRTKSNDKSKNLLKLKLQPIKTELPKKYIKEQANEAVSIRQSHKIERRYSPPKRTTREEIDIRQSLKIRKKAEQHSKIDIKLQNEQAPKRIKSTIFNTQTRSNGSSRQSINPILQKLSSFVSSQTHQQIINTRILNQKLLGQLSGIWWSVVDSLFVSLQKLVKVKRTYEKQQTKKQRNSKSVSPQKGIRQSGNIRESGRIRQSQIGKRQQNMKMKGKTLTKVKPSIEMAKAYSHLQQEIVENEKVILKYFEDANHISLILQAFFYEKVTIYMIGSVRKWDHTEQQFQIHNLGVELLPMIIDIRKLMIDILIQECDNEGDGKIKKPKYIAKEKKLIQISKFTTIMKAQLQKTLQNLGSPHRYKIFEYPVLKQYSNLYKLQCKWRNKVFDIPIPPYIAKKDKNKKHLLVLQPLNILYKYNKKQQILLIDPQAQYFLNIVSQYFQILFYTHADKEISLLNFMGVLEKLQVLGILDKHYVSYREGKPVKDLHKIGTGYDIQSMVILDDKSNQKFYHDCEERLFLVDGNHSHMKICRVKGKVVKKQENNENFLEEIANKLINYAEKGVHWSNSKSP